MHLETRINPRQKEVEVICVAHRSDEELGPKSCIFESITRFPYFALFKDC